ncbi:hypothetical protein [Nocardia camponoti]|uniref:PE-PPE domain-containing protein n=1 Tax=Nocardia camponoti TaxID=1616106 RepID=A0A917QGN2_9NOCA|nr:hypothetical protein [Nocardia camponoti]GGK49682.1 hypothetical protein GCM10011591_21450 [Nocardia camponoti]
MIDVLIMGASWASPRHRVTSAFAAALDPARFRPRLLGNSGIGTTARTALLSELARRSGPVVLAGYAQGAAIVGDVAAQVCGDSSHSVEIVGCALISDPYRPAGMSIGTDPGGHGILGQRSVGLVPTYWVATSGDLTTALPVDSALRMTAEACEYAELSTEEQMVGWARRLVDADVREQLRKFPFGLRMWDSRSTELNELSAVLLTKPYVDSYLGVDGVASLARVLNRELKIC